MARKKTLKLSVLNIKTQPEHSPEKYVELLRYGLEKKLIGFVRGSDKMCFKSLFLPDGKKEVDEIRGCLCKFTDIGPDSDWMDLNLMEQVPSDMAPNVPGNFKPNSKVYPFVFFPKKHLMIIESSISPNSLKDGVFKIFQKPEVYNLFGQIDVETIKDSRSIDYILSLDTLKSLEIRLSIPNPEDLSNEKKRILERCAKAKVGEIRHKEKSMSGYNMDISDETKTLLLMSADDGSAKAVYKRGGKNETISTTEAPLLVPISYDPNVMAPEQVLYNSSHKVLSIVQKQREKLY